MSFNIIISVNFQQANCKGQRPANFLQKKYVDRHMYSFPPSSSVGLQPGSMFANQPTKSSCGLPTYQTPDGLHILSIIVREAFNSQLDTNLTPLSMSLLLHMPSLSAKMRKIFAKAAIDAGAVRGCSLVDRERKSAQSALP